MASNFSFENQREQSKIKTEIVTKYFNAWANILTCKVPKVGYIDLFAGPGKYEDDVETESTPMIIIKDIIKNKKFMSKVFCYFNEKDPILYEKLVNNIYSIDGINELKFKPTIKNYPIDENTPQKFSHKKIPCFCFIDPAGYKGLSLELIKAFGKDYGTDIIFFFNYNDINRGINNPKVNNEMLQLFGQKHLSLLRSKIVNIKDGQNRESIIVNEMCEAINDSGIQYVLPFRFKFEGKARTSHYLIFATKNITAHKIMKEIMYKIGEKDFQGVGKFEYIPSCDRAASQQLSIIDLYTRTLDELKEHLLTYFSKQNLKVKEIFDIDSPNSKFILKQYQKALLELEAEKKIECRPVANERHSIKGVPTLSEKTLVIFP